jgi:predicted nucleic acid-binding protein
MGALLIYLDSAAIVKLVRSEAESAELADWLASRAGSQLVSSVLVEVEVTRALRRVAAEALPNLAALLARVSRVEVNAAVRARAIAYPSPLLRILDAIHLATAESVAERPGAQLDAFVTYDARLAKAAAALGLPVLSPGS